MKSGGRSTEEVKNHSAWAVSLGERGRSMSSNVDLGVRTRAFALRVIRLYATLPQSTIAQILGKQVLRSGTSVGAHCREARRGRSTAEFVSKLHIALQELDETTYWLELISDSGILPEERLAGLCSEANELTAILVASIKTAKRRK